MVKYLFNVLFFMALFLTACGGSSSSTSTTDTLDDAAPVSGSSIAGLVGSAFSSSASFSSPQNGLLSQYLVAADDFCDNLGKSPAQFYVMTAGQEATVGSAESPITVAASDFCIDRQTNEANSGSGSDDKGLYVMFRLVGTGSQTCTDSDSNTLEVEISKGFGVMRVNTDGNSEIGGRFTLNDEVFNCTVVVNSSGEIVSQSCTDSDDNVVTPSEGAVCVSESVVPEEPSFVKGQWGLNESGTLQYDCAFPTVNTTASIEEILDNPDNLFTLDCTSLTQAGFNTVTVGITFIVNPATGAITEITSDASIHNAIGILHSQGFNVLLEANYVISSDGGQTSDDTHEAFATLVDSAVGDEYLTNLENIALEFAQIAADHDVFMFAPYMEVDKALGDDFAAASTWGQDKIAALRAIYSGKIVWLSSTPSFDVGIDVSGFDVFGFNTSPLKTQDLSAFKAQVDEGITRMTNLCDDDPELMCFITSIGFWGSSITDSTYWFGSDNKYLEVFDYAFDVTDSNDLPGLIIFDGSTDLGELAIGSDETLMTNLSEYFSGK